MKCGRFFPNGPTCLSWKSWIWTKIWPEGGIATRDNREKALKFPVCYAVSCITAPFNGRQVFLTETITPILRILSSCEWQCKQLTTTFKVMQMQTVDLEINFFIIVNIITFFLLNEKKKGIFFLKVEIKQIFILFFFFFNVSKCLTSAIAMNKSKGSKYRGQKLLT